MFKSIAQLFGRIHWGEFFKSKGVLTGIGATIAGLVAWTGHSIDPLQIDTVIKSVDQIAQGVSVLLTIGTVVFRTTAETRIMAPAPAALEKIAGPEAVPANKTEAKAVLQTLTAGDVVTPAQAVAAAVVVPQKLNAPPSP